MHVARTTEPILVVGAGPVGLTMACELTRHGVPVRIIDKAESPSLYSKAQVVHSRTLEILEEMDAELAARVVAHGLPTSRLNFYTQDWQRLAGVEIGEPDTRYPYMLNISQRETERLLTEHLVSRGVLVERQVELKSFAADAEGVTCTLNHADGRTETVRTPWLLGCDGSHSAVRKGAGIEFTGESYEWRITQADVHIDWSSDVPTNEVFGFVSPSGAIGAFPLPGGNRYRLMAFDTHSPPDLTIELFQQLLDERGPPGCRVSDPRWMVQFNLHCRQVPRYQAGRVLLAGDAAHIHSPAGGQGMNTGMQDAYNLAWKLALAYHGVAGQKLIESYHAERHPVAQAVLRSTDMGTRYMGTAMTLESRFAVALRNQAMRFMTSLGFVQRMASRAMSELGISYEDSPIVGQHRAGPWSRTDGPSVEAPGLRDYFAFGDGPTPGTRVSDIRFTDSGGVTQRLLPFLRGGRHQVLLFDGGMASAEGYANLVGIADAVRGKYGDRFRSHVIVPAAARPEALAGWDHTLGSIMLDARGELHRAFGARSECLYLVRPDGYVGFRTQPASRDALVAFLDRIFS